MRCKFLKAVALPYNPENWYIEALSVISYQPVHIYPIVYKHALENSPTDPVIRSEQYGTASYLGSYLFKEEIKDEK